jgi:hypothetical protein
MLLQKKFKQLFFCIIKLFLNKKKKKKKNRTLGCILEGHLSQYFLRFQ